MVFGYFIKTFWYRYTSYNINCKIMNGFWGGEVVFSDKIGLINLQLKMETWKITIERALLWYLGKACTEMLTLHNNTHSWDCINVQTVYHVLMTAQWFWSHHIMQFHPMTMFSLTSGFISSQNALPWCHNGVGNPTELILLLSCQVLGKWRHDYDLS